MADGEGIALDWMRRPPVEGLRALVVGGGSGIGEASALMLAANGAKVVVADRRLEMAEAVAGQIGGDRAAAIRLDVSHQNDIDAAVAHMAATHGGIDILVNSAGVIMPAALEDCAIEDWRQSFLVNVEGALMLARSCLPHLRESRAASIVHVASLAGGRAYPNGGPYGPSKAALISLTRQMALEWAEFRVRVNVVSPGSIDTPLLQANMRPEVQRARAEKIPLGRMGFSREVAAMIGFLASPAAAYITGQEILVDGGLSQSLMMQRFYANA